MNNATLRDGLDPSRRCKGPEIEGLLQDGIDAARAGHDQRARDLLLQVVEQDPSCARAWLWLSGVVQTPGERELCLEQVISIDPDHAASRHGLIFLWEQRQARKHEPAVLEAEAPLPAQPSPEPGAFTSLDETPDPTRAHAPDTPAQTAVQPETLEQVEVSIHAGVSTPSGARVSEGTAITQDSAGSLVTDMDELMRPAIAAARSGHAQRARDLLARVISVDDKHVSAWMWLSYVASDDEERDRCLQRVLTLAVPGITPTLASAGALPVRGAVTAPGPEPVSRAGPRLAVSTAPADAVVGTPGAVRPEPPSVAPFHGAGITLRLRTLYLKWASNWARITLFYLAGIALAELLISFAPPRVGLVAHAAVLLGMLIHAARVDGKKEQAFLVSLAFAPLIRIVSLSLPLADLPLLYWYPITSIPLFAAALVAAPTLGYAWPDLGLNLRRWGLQLVISLTGIAFGALEYWILRPEPLVAAFTWQALVWPSLILLISTGLLEELIFRGLLQRASVDLLGLRGIGYVALVFAVLHIGYRSLLDVLLVAAVGLFFGWVVHRTRSLLGVTLAHGLTNIVLFLVMPFIMG
jgi:membrane protease YdiL (CAAX protease family)